MKKLLCIIIVLMGISSLSFADTAEVRVGLSYNDNTIESVALTSNNGFTFGISNGGYYVNLASFMTNSLSLEKDSGYRIELSASFASGSETSAIVELIKGLGYNSYSGYKDGFKVYVENSLDTNQLNQIIAALTASMPDYTFTIASPSNTGVFVMSANTPVFYYDSNDFNYVLKDLKEEFVTYNGKTYRNGIGVKKNTTGNFTVINYLAMKEYLYGVLPKEMSGSWHIEALKAQAVAARNYAYTTMGKHENEFFDLCATTDCQVYGGASVEKPTSNQAVDETADVVLRYNGKLVSAFYHSNSGGYTANIGDVWSGEQAYLVSVYDPYSINQPQYDWSLTYSPSEMQSLLNNGGYNIGTLKDIVIDEQRSSGRVVSIKAIGTNATKTFEKEQFRAFLGYSTLRSMLFNLEKSSNVTVYNGVNESTTDTSSVHVISASGISNSSGTTVYAYDGVTKKDYKQSSDGYTFVGHGYGHGIGMSQWGAKAMAESGFTYDQILTHYYKDTTIEVMN